MSGHFLQSKEWEEFQRSLVREVFRVNGILLTKLPLAFGKSYLYAAGVWDMGHGTWEDFLGEVNKIAKRENAVFLKFEPMNFLKAAFNAFRKSKKEVQPQKTIVLDLTKSEEELLKEMHQKTRYNIRLASRRPNVKCQMSNNIESFWGLMQKTSGRDKFSPHTKGYYAKLIPFTQLLTVQYNGKTIAANIVLFYGDTAYYLHGASDYEYRNLMAPYLLHWETIKYAKEHGYKKYDLWGIDEKKWPGVTRFKRGLGGWEVEYTGSYDYVFQPFWYQLYALRNKIKKLL